MMRTMLVILALLLPIYGEQKGTKPTGNQKQIQPVKQRASPPSQVIVIHEQHSQDKGEGTQNDAETYFHRLLRADNLPNLLLFFAGLGGIGVGVCTLRQIKRQTTLLNDYVGATRDGVIAMRDSASVAERSLRILENEQRARVGASAVILRSLHPGEKSKAKLVLKNFGKSTAINVRAEWYMEAEPAKKMSWHASGASDPDVFLYPGTDCTMPIETQGPISVEVFEGIGTGKMFLYVWGQVSYRLIDEEQSLCSSLFSFVYNAELGEFLHTGGFWQTEEAF